MTLKRWLKRFLIQRLRARGHVLIPEWHLPEVPLEEHLRALIRLPKRIPYHLAMELALTGMLIGAERAAELGLVNRVAEPGGALEAARALAREIVANGPLATAGPKKILSAAVDWTEAEAWERQREISGPIFASEDAREGATAFAEKRPPQWRGR